MTRSELHPAFELRKVILAVGAFAACGLAAGLVHGLVGDWGRDIRPTAALLAGLLVVAMGGLVGWRRVRVAESLGALIVVELLFVAAIGWFGYGGLPRPDRFFFAWFLPGNLAIALPWLLGTGLGAWRSRG